MMGVVHACGDLSEAGRPCARTWQGWAGMRGDHAKNAYHGNLAGSILTGIYLRGGCRNISGRVCVYTGARHARLRPVLDAGKP